MAKNVNAKSKQWTPAQQAAMLAKPLGAVSDFLRRAGHRGGKRRMTSMTPAERSKISRLGGLARGRKLAAQKKIA